MQDRSKSKQLLQLQPACKCCTAKQCRAWSCGTTRSDYCKPIAMICMPRACATSAFAEVAQRMVLADASTICGPSQQAQHACSARHEHRVPAPPRRPPRPPRLCTPAHPQALGTPRARRVRARAGSAAPAGSGCAGTGCRSRPCSPRRVGPARRSAPHHSPDPRRARGLQRAPHQRALTCFWRASITCARAPFANFCITCGCALCMTARRC